MPAAEQMHLPPAMDHLPIGEIAARPPQQRPPRLVPVRVKVSRARPLLDVEQQREQPRVAVARQHQVGVMVAQHRVHRRQQLPGRLQRHLQRTARPRAAVPAAPGVPVGDVEPRRRPQVGVNVGIEIQDAQRRGRRLHGPRVVERDHAAPLHPAARQRKHPARGRIAQRQRHVGVVVIEVGETGQHPVQQPGLRRRAGCFHGQHVDLAGEQVAPPLAPQPERGRLVAQPLPRLAQPRERPGGTERHREGVAQAVAAAVIAKHPQRYAAVVGIEIKQPAVHGKITNDE